MDPIIRCAARTDLDALATLFDGYRQFYRQSSDLAGARRFLAERFEHEESVIFVASLPDMEHLVGFTQLYPFFSSVGMQRVWVLNDLFVAQGARRRGVARALMEAAHDFAASTSALRVELATEATNKSAQTLYEAIGYERDLDWRYGFHLGER